MREPRGYLCEFGRFHIDPLRRLLSRDGHPVPLVPKAFDTLLALIERRGQTVEKAQLMEAVWPDTAVEEGSLTQNIFLVRKALGERPNDHQYIVTVPGRGYQFVASVKEFWAEAGEPPVPAAGWSGPRGPATPMAIAVLPFNPMGAEIHDRYLGLGMADALITRLSSVKHISVRPTSAIANYASGRDPLTTGRELGVDFLLDGNIQDLGDRIRVTVQLVRMRDAAIVWGGKFDEQFGNIFRVQDSISGQVARSLLPILSSEETSLLNKRHTENVEAYQAYIKGRYFWNKRTEKGLKTSILYFQKAIEIDPAYALAYAGLADSYSLLGGYSYLAPRDAWPRAKAAAIKALEIDDRLAEAHTSLADVKLYFDWDLPGAESEYQRALDLNPNYPTAHHWYTWYLLVTERLAEAAEEIRWAQALDPLSLIINTTLGLPFYYARQYDQAIECLNKVIELDPHFPLAHYYLGSTYTQLKLYEEAVGEFQQALALDDAPSILASLGHAYAMRGEVAKTNEVLEQLRQLAARRYVSPYHVSIVYTGLRRTDVAFEWLYRAHEERSGWLVWLKIDPVLSDLHGDRRFTDLMQRIGLANHSASCRPEGQTLERRRRRQDPRRAVHDESAW